MKRLTHIQATVEQTLNSLDQAERATANPFLYTRILARLEKREEGAWGAVTRILARPAVVVATLVLVALMNASIFLQAPAPASASNRVQDEDQVFLREYFNDPSEGGFLVTNTDQP